MHPQRLSHGRDVVPSGEPLGRLHPDLLPERLPPGGQPAPLRIPHVIGVLLKPHRVSPLRHHPLKVSNLSVVGSNTTEVAMFEAGAGLRVMAR